MKKFSVLLLGFAAVAVQATAAGWWTPWENNTVPSKGTRLLQPDAYKTYAVNAALKNTLFGLGDNPQQARVIELPAPDGTLQPFRIWQAPVMAPALSEKYPGIKTFAAVSVLHPSVSARIDWTGKGFHAMVYDDKGTWFVDPYSSENDNFYISYFKKDYTKPVGSHMTCLVGEDEEPGKISLDDQLPVLEKLNGAQKKTYRLALACTGEYAVAVAGAAPTKQDVLSAMVTSINRVTGVYERELAVSFQLIGNTDTLIALDGTTDIFSNLSGGAMLGQNQYLVDSVIGTANYDIGHVFSTGGGGIAGLGVVCNPGSKARGVTGLFNPVGDAFDIDYVAHEMGHQFGGSHTFNANNSGMGSCTGNASTQSAYEPGSGSTIMAYAGICGTLNNIQAHSDAYFHARSLDQISTFITTGTGGTCPVAVATGNDIPQLPVFATTYTIPHLTAFEITAPEATDATHDELTYCWEQWNRGDFGQSFANVRLNGPIFRSFLPDTSRTRIFPTLKRVLTNTTSYLGEKLPDTTRSLNFRVTVRDVMSGIGSFNFATDTVKVNVVYTGAAPFRVTSQAAVATLTGNTQQTVTWDVSQTDVAPISATNVNIYLSVDSGYTWSYVLAANTANDGSETVTVPNVDASNRVRIKVKGAGNIFFDLNDAWLSIVKDPTAVRQPSWSEAVSVYPVPASATLYIEARGLNKTLDARITNAVGQTTWTGAAGNSQTAVPVASWAKGVYYLQLADRQSGERAVKTIVVQ